MYIGMKNLKENKNLSNGRSNKICWVAVILVGR
jgi:hypothetical protein